MHDDFTNEIDTSGQPLDLNGDGQIDASGIDTTGSGHVDTIYIDTNGDGQYDRVEHDGNLDGLTDVIGVDATGSGYVDTIYLDINGDGEFDKVEHYNFTDESFEQGVSRNSLSAYGHIGNNHNYTYLEDELAAISSDHEQINITQAGHDLDNDGQISFMEVPTNSLHIGRDPYNDNDYGIMPAQFNINSGEDGIIGNPGEDMSYWHMQTHDDTCAVVSQEYILDDLTWQHFNEDDLVNVAIEHGWYTPGGGTTMDNVGKLLEYYGLHVERGSGTIDSLESALANGHKVIVGVDANEIWSNGTDSIHDQLYSVMGIPDSDANHAVEVIGIDRSDPQHLMVILNDPGHPGGQGSMIPLELFKQSWADSGNFMVEASKYNT